MKNSEYLEVQRIYNEKKLYEFYNNDCPFWNLDDNEQNYYLWLFKKQGLLKIDEVQQNG